MKKVDLQKEGFDVTRVSDKIYVLSNGKYVLLDNELYSKLSAGQLRVWNPGELKFQISIHSDLRILI